MFSYDDERLVQDREDLIGVLRMRFGGIAPGIIDTIYAFDEPDDMERLILVAANAPDLKTFLEELEEGSGNFKITGERFNPLGATASNGGRSE